MTKAARTLNIAAVSLGNSLEWFEIVVYGYFAPILAPIFFPTASPAAGLLLTFATFGITFVFRPVGAIVLGGYADRHGRKKALLWSLGLMTMGSAVIALLPGFDQIGLLAPLLLVLARIVQGISVGGEFGIATAYLAENDAERRGFFASLQFASQGFAAILATTFGVLITSLLTPDQIHAWGWRLPFLFGLLLAPIGYYIRNNLPEEAVLPEQTSKPSVFPPAPNLAVAIGVMVLGTVATYTIIFLPTYAVRQMGVDAPSALAASLITAIIQMLIVPFLGALSDRLGRTPVSLVAAGLVLIGGGPMFVWLSLAPSAGNLLLIQIILGALTAIYVAPLPALMSDLFSRDMRGRGLSISYAISVAAFGGFAPFIHSWLIALTQTPIAPSYYLVLAAAISIVSLLTARRSGHL